MMEFDAFQEINEIRARRWHRGGDWSLLEWCGAMGGEAGEAANIAKKIKRINDSLPNIQAGTKVTDEPLLRLKLAREVADTQIYGFIIQSRLGVSAASMIAQVFDEKSIEYGFPERAPFRL